MRAYHIGDLFVGLICVLDICEYAQGEGFLLSSRVAVALCGGRLWRDGHGFRGRCREMGVFRDVLHEDTGMKGQSQKGEKGYEGRTSVSSLVEIYTACIYAWLGLDSAISIPVSIPGKPIMPCSAHRCIRLEHSRDPTAHVSAAHSY